MQTKHGQASMQQGHRHPLNAKIKKKNKTKQWNKAIKKKKREKGEIKRKKKRKKRIQWTETLTWTFECFKYYLTYAARDFLKLKQVDTPQFLVHKGEMLF